jgi:hypothetical protein
MVGFGFYISSVLCSITLIMINDHFVIGISCIIDVRFIVLIGPKQPFAFYSHYNFVPQHN